MIQIQGKSKLSSYEIEWNSDKWKEKVEPQWIMEPNQKRCSKGNNKILWMLIFKCQLCFLSSFFAFFFLISFFWVWEFGIPNLWIPNLVTDLNFGLYYPLIVQLAEKSLNRCSWLRSTHDKFNNEMNRFPVIFFPL